jgi:hypothetical protein
MAASSLLATVPTPDTAAPPAPPAAPAERLRLKDIHSVRDQVYVFLERNPAIESTAPLEAAWHDICRSRSLNGVYDLVIRNALLTMDKALRFALYMKTDVEPLLDDSGVEVARRPAPFNSDEALILVSEFYDEGVEELAGAPEDDSDSSDGEESDEGLENVSEGDEGGDDSESGDSSGGV